MPNGLVSGNVCWWRGRVFGIAFHFRMDFDGGWRWRIALWLADIMVPAIRRDEVTKFRAIHPCHRAAGCRRSFFSILSHRART